MAGLHRRRDQAGRRIEGGVDVAAARAAAARAAAVALRSMLVVLQAVRRDAGAVGRQHPAHLRQRLTHADFRRRQLERALEQAVGQVRQVLLHARDAEVQVDLVVVRLDVGVGDRPVLAVPVVRLRLEVQIRQAQRQPSPDVRLPAEAPGAHPRVVRAGIRVILLVDDDVLAVVGAAPALDVGIDVLVRVALAVGRLADRVLVEAERLAVGRHLAAAGVIVRPLHRFQLGVEVELLAGFEEEDVQAARRQDVRGHSPGGSGPDDDRIVGPGEVDFTGFRLQNAQQQGHAMNLAYFRASSALFSTQRTDRIDGPDPAQRRIRGGQAHEPGQRAAHGHEPPHRIERETVDLRANPP